MYGMAGKNIRQPLGLETTPAGYLFVGRIGTPSSVGPEGRVGWPAGAVKPPEGDPLRVRNGSLSLLDHDSFGFTTCAHKINYTIHDQRARGKGPVAEEMDDILLQGSLVRL